MNNPILEEMKRGTSNPILSAMKSAGSTDVATTQAVSVGADPEDLANAKKELNKSEYIGYCQQFVEKMTGSGWKGASAIDAWNNQQDQAKTGTEGIKTGDLLYFSPNESNQNNGHTGIYMGGNQFISATDAGIAPYNLSDWQNMTGQRILGYIPQGETQENPILKVMKGAN